MSGLGPAQLARPARVVQLIKSLNVGGATVQALTTTRLLREAGCETYLWRGSEERYEGDMDALAREMGLRPMRIPSLRRNVHPRDLRGLASLAYHLRRVSPDILHTHGAKAGALGRLAATVAFPNGGRPSLVHTFHGHSLRGYFSAPQDRLHLAVEQLLAPRTDRLVAVSEEVRDELVELGVAGAERFSVVPVGFDFSAYDVPADVRREHRERLRADLGLPPDAFVVTVVARLAPIKRIDRFLRVASLLLDEPRARFLVVGDGESGQELRSCAAARALGDRLRWTGYRRDIPSVCFASDVMVLTSDNEGTPVSLIEAQAAGLPVVSTRVGGAATVVEHGRNGFCFAPGAEAEMARAIRRLADDPAYAERLGTQGRESALAAFSRDRLLGDILELYGELLSSSDQAVTASANGNPRTGAAASRVPPA